ncbi:MAG: hypothetical protein GEU75_09450 [Dehalococcoidia bacterium]|nr:hypothetical protein [Dehalococcoidia bacterium]
MAKHLPLRFVGLLAALVLGFGGVISLPTSASADGGLLDRILGDDDEDDGNSVVGNVVKEVTKVLDDDDEDETSGLLDDGLDDATGILDDGEDEDEDSVPQEAENIVKDIVDDDDDDSSLLEDTLDKVTGDDDEDGDLVEEVTGIVGDILGDDDDTSNMAGGVLDDVTGILGDDDDDSNPVSLIDETLDDLTRILGDDDEPVCQALNCEPDLIDTLTDALPVGLDEKTGVLPDLDGGAGLLGPLNGIVGGGDEDGEGGQDSLLEDLLGDESLVGGLVGNEGDLLGGVLDEDEENLLDGFIPGAVGDLLGDDSLVGGLAGNSGDLLGGVLDDDGDGDGQDGDLLAGLPVIGGGDDLFGPLNGIVGGGDEDGEGDQDSLLEDLLGDNSLVGSLVGNEGDLLGGVLDEDEENLLDGFIPGAVGDLLGDDSLVGGLAGNSGDLLGGVLDDDGDGDGQDGDLLAGLPVIGGGDDLFGPLNGIVGGGDEDGEGDQDSLLEDLLGDNSLVGSLVGNEGDLLGGVLDEDEENLLDGFIPGAVGDLLGDDSLVGGLGGNSGDLLGGVLDDDGDDDDSGSLLGDLFGNLPLLDNVITPFVDPLDLCLGVDPLDVDSELGAGCNQDPDCGLLDLNCTINDLLGPVVGPGSLIDPILDLCLGYEDVQLELGSGCSSASGDDDSDDDGDDTGDDTGNGGGNGGANGSDGGSSFNTAIGAPVGFTQFPLPPAAPIEATRGAFVPAQAGDGGLLGVTPFNREASASYTNVLALILTLLTLLTLTCLVRARKG